MYKFFEIWKVYKGLKKKEIELLIIQSSIEMEISEKT